MKSRDVKKFKVATGLNETFLNLLVKTDMSGAELARRVDASETSVSHWKTGHTRVPGAVIAYLELLATIREASR